MKSLISIVIPTYKRATMLDRAINSCLTQSYQNIEVIVVDDNNPDSEYRKSTSEMMKKYELNSKVKYIKMKKNGGGVKARNFGIENSNGNYIAFLDDDDYFLKDKLKHQLGYMKKNNLDACFTGSETYDETKNKLIKIKRYTNFNDYNDLLRFHLVEMIVSTQTFMFKKEILNAVGGFKEVPAGQEFCLMYNVIKNGFKVGYLDEVLTRICIHSGERITTSKKKIEAEKYLLNLKKQHFGILTFKEKQKIRYIYKYNVWKKYQSSGSIKQYLWLCYIIVSHPIQILKKMVK